MFKTLKLLDIGFTWCQEGDRKGWSHGGFNWSWKGSEGLGKLSVGLGKVLYGLRKVLDSLGKVSDILGKVANGLGKVLDGLRKVLDGLRKVSDGLRKLSDVLGKVSDGIKKSITISSVQQNISACSRFALSRIKKLAHCKALALYQEKKFFGCSSKSGQKKLWVTWKAGADCYSVLFVSLFTLDLGLISL